MVMKLKCLSNGLQVMVFTLGAGMVASGCCSKSSGGHYSFYASPPPAVASAPETSQASSNVVIPLYKESVTVGTRQVDDGTVRLRKVVKTETVNEPVQLRRKTVVIDREPAATAQGAGSCEHPFP